MEEEIRTNGPVTVRVPWIVEMQNIGVNIFIYIFLPIKIIQYNINLLQLEIELEINFERPNQRN
jgi:hypothetical protein